MSIWLIELHEWFIKNSVEIVGHFLTLLGIVAGACVIVWQMSRQHRDSLSLQRENTSEEIKLKIYETLIVKIRQCNDSIVSASTFFNSIPVKVSNYQYEISKGLNPRPPSERIEDAIRLHDKAHNSISDIVKEFEAWAVVFSGFEVFQKALLSANHDILNSFFEAFIILIETLPIDPPDDAPENIPRPITKPLLTKQKIEQLKKSTGKYVGTLWDAAGYVHDLRIETQNNLLSNLFTHKLEARKPLDSYVKVISNSSDKMEELLKYFDKETDWGRLINEYESKKDR